MSFSGKGHLAKTRTRSLADAVPRLLRNFSPWAPTRELVGTSPRTGCPRTCGPQPEDWQPDLSGFNSTEHGRCWAVGTVMVHVTVVLGANPRTGGHHKLAGDGVSYPFAPRLPALATQAKAHQRPGSTEPRAIPAARRPLAEVPARIPGRGALSPRGAS